MFINIHLKSISNYIVDLYMFLAELINKIMNKGVFKKYMFFCRYKRNFR